MEAETAEAQLLQHIDADLDFCHFGLNVVSSFYSKIKYLIKICKCKNTSSFNQKGSRWDEILDKELVFVCLHLLSEQHRLISYSMDAGTSASC